MIHSISCPRRGPRWSVAAALVVFMAVLTPAAPPDHAPDPNVLLISVDTLRADHVSAYGYPRRTTPRIDELIENGVRFAQARTVEPLTGPAVASLLTSTHPHEHGASRNGLRVRAGLESLPRRLEARGHVTAAFVGSWTLRDRLCGLGEHFGHYAEILTRKRWLGLAKGEATADDVTAAALEWIRRQRYRPWLAWAHYVEPHAPYRAHQEQRAALGLAATGALSDLDRYDTEIAFVDRAIGALLDGIRAAAPGSETLVVFVSDHGESLGEHGDWGHGRHLYETALRIPMAISWPGRVAPQTVLAPALITDLAPTVLSLLGVDRPLEFGGYDWTAVLAGAPPPPDRVTRYQTHKGAVLSDHDSERMRGSGLLEVAVIHRAQKEIWRLGRERASVFDLVADPGELAGRGGSRQTPSEALGAWLDRVRAGLSEADREPVPPLDAESSERLRSLGYVD